MSVHRAVVAAFFVAACERKAETPAVVVSAPPAASSPVVQPASVPTSHPVAVAEAPATQPASAPTSQPASAPATDPKYLASVQLEWLDGCRGNRDQAEVLDPTAVPKKLPKDACVSALQWPACVDCWQDDTFAEEKKRMKARDKQVDRLNKAFPDGPFVKVTLPPLPESPLRPFFYAADMLFDTSCNQGVDVSSKLHKATLKPVVEGVSWFEAQAGNVYGVVLATDENDALQRLATFDADRTLKGFAPKPFIHAPPDECNDCASCGD